MSSTSTRVATFQTIWDCKWSRPGHRLYAVGEGFQPESAWVCIRTGPRRPISEEQCERCAHWEADERQLH
jgi:hypothetical protein